MKHDNNFDLLRLLAACQVVYMHAGAHMALPKGDGLFFDVVSQFPGVAVFFVISGFLVSDSYLRSRSVAFFAINRALRIYPALVVNILTIEILFVTTGGIHGSPWAFLKYLGTYLATASSYFANLTFPGSGHATSWFFPWYPSGVLWTLTVELSFYVLLPLVLGICAKYRMVGTIALLVLMAGSFAIAHQAGLEFYALYPSLNELVVPYFWIFGIGILVRLWWDRISLLFEERALWWLVGYGALTVLFVQVLQARTSLNYKIAPDVIMLTRVAIMGCLIISSAYTLKRTASFLHGNDFSYGLYLWHMLVVTTLLGFGLRERWWLWLVVYGCSFGLAVGSWLLVEKRALKLKPKFIKNSEPLSPATYRHVVFRKS